MFFGYPNRALDWLAIWRETMFFGEFALPGKKRCVVIWIDEFRTKQSAERRNDPIVIAVAWTNWSRNNYSHHPVYP